MLEWFKRNAAKRYCLITFCIVTYICIYMFTRSKPGNYQKLRFEEDETDIKTLISTSLSNPTLNTYTNEHTFQEVFFEVLSLGCYSATNLEKIKKSLWTSTQTTSIKLCFVECKKKSAYYAGLTRGSMCLCSLQNFDVIANPKEESKLCDMKCPLNSEETCGGGASVEMYRLKSAYFGEKDLPPNFEEMRSSGCFKYTTEKSLLSHEKTVSRCILRCGKINLPLALWRDDLKQCSCDHFTLKFNLSHKQLTCDDESWKVYRTLAENKLCKPLRLLPKKSSHKRIVLLSAPGSGNSWARHLIEQASGIYTGSFYHDPTMYKLGSIGEDIPIQLNRTVVVKDHFIQTNNLIFYDGIIFLVRNPFKSFISEFNRQNAVNYSQVGHANMTLFYSKEFEKYLNEALKLWKGPFFSVSSTKKPLHLLIYEDLIKDPIKEIRKIINFLKMKSGFEPADLEQRLLCMSENLQGDYKRKSRVLKAIPFTEERIKQMHAMISSAESLLSSSHNEMRLPKYEI